MRKNLLNFKTHQSGFTLIELLIVVTIIVIVIAVGAVSYSQVAKNSRNADREAELAKLQQILEQYFADHGEYPNTGGLSSYWGEGGQFQSTDHSCRTINSDAVCCLLGNMPDADFNYASNYQPPSGEVCKAPFNAYLDPDQNLRQDVLYEDDGSKEAFYSYASDGQTYALATHLYEGVPPEGHDFNSTTAPYYFCEALQWRLDLYDPNNTDFNSYVVQSKAIKKPSATVLGTHSQC